MPSSTETPQQKSMIIAYCLWLVGGLFGVHRFYLNAIKSGIGQFLLLFPSLGLFIYSIWYMDKHYPLGNVPDPEPHLEPFYIGIVVILIIQALWVLVDLVWIYLTIRKALKKQAHLQEQVEAF